MDGCNILLNRIPNEGRIYIVQNEKEISVKKDNGKGA